MSQPTVATPVEREPAWPPALTPYIVVSDARRAMDWYVEVFGAHRRGEVMPGHLDHALGLGQRLQLFVAEAHDQPPVADGDRGGHRALTPYGCLGGIGHLEIARRRQAVRDEGRLEGHHPAPPGQRMGDVPAHDRAEVPMRLHAAEGSRCGGQAVPVRVRRSRSIAGLS